MDNGFNKVCPSGNHMIDCQHDKKERVTLYYCADCDKEISQSVFEDNNGLCESCWVEKMEGQEPEN